MTKDFPVQLQVRQLIPKNIGSIVQGDINGNRIIVSLVDGVYPVDITGYTTITFTVEKPDGTPYVDSLGDRIVVLDAKRGEISIILDYQAIVAPGICKATIEVYKGSYRMTSAKMIYLVLPALAWGANPESEAAYPLLLALMAQLSSAEETRVIQEEGRSSAEELRLSAEITRLANEIIRQSQETDRQASIADIENRFAKLTTAQQQEAEVINARTSTVKSKTFDSLNARMEEAEQDHKTHLAENVQKFAEVDADILALETNKVDEVEGKGLSTNDYDNTEKAEVAKVALKADKTYVDNQISAIGNGSPKGTYATLSALQTAYPTGTTGIYVVVADGNWYYWNGSAWTSGGTYQSTGIADGAVTPDKLGATVSKYKLLRYSWYREHISFNTLGTSGYSITLGGTLSLQFSEIGTPVFDFTTLTNIEGGTLADGKVTFTIQRTGALVLDLSVATPTIKVVGYADLTANMVTLAFIYGSGTSIIFPAYGLLLDIANEMKTYQTFDRSYRGYGFNAGADCEVDIEQSIASSASLTLTVNGGFAILLAKDYGNSILWNYSGTMQPTFADGVYADGVYTVTIPHNTNLVLDPYSLTVSLQPFGSFSPQKILLCNCIHGRAFNGLLFDMYQRGKIEKINTNNPDIILNTLLPRKKFFTVSHRGVCGIFPENSIPSFEQAGIIGYDLMEADVQRTSDGIYIMMHDATVDRTTDGTGNVTDLTYAQIQALTIDAEKNISLFTGLKVPTLAEYLQACGKYGVIPVIELKIATTYISDILEIIAGNGFKNKCFILSQALASIVTIRTADAEQPLIYCPTDLTTANCDTVAALGGVMIAHYYTNATDALCEYAHSLNMRYGVWELDSGAYNYNAKGYDFIISDTQSFGVDVNSIAADIPHDLYLDDYTEISSYMSSGLSYSADFENLAENKYSVYDNVLKVYNSATVRGLDLPLDTTKYELGDVINADFKINNHIYTETTGTEQAVVVASLEITGAGESPKSYIILNTSAKVGEWEQFKVSCPIPWPVKKMISEGLYTTLRLRIGVYSGTIVLWELKDLTVWVKRVSKYIKV